MIGLREGIFMGRPWTVPSLELIQAALADVHLTGRHVQDWVWSIAHILSPVHHHQSLSFITEKQCVVFDLPSYTPTCSLWGCVM